MPLIETELDCVVGTIITTIERFAREHARVLLLCTTPDTKVWPTSHNVDEFTPSKPTRRAGRFPWETGRHEKT